MFSGPISATGLGSGLCQREFLFSLDRPSRSFVRSTTFSIVSDSVRVRSESPRLPLRVVEFEGLFNLSLLREGFSSLSPISGGSDNSGLSAASFAALGIGE